VLCGQMRFAAQLQLTLLLTFVFGLFFQFFMLTFPDALPPDDAHLPGGNKTALLEKLPLSVFVGAHSPGGAAFAEASKASAPERGLAAVNQDGSTALVDEWTQEEIDEFAKQRGGLRGLSPLDATD